MMVNNLPAVKIAAVWLVAVLLSSTDVVVTAGACTTRCLSPQVVEAHQEGKCKPDPRVYKLCLERLDVQPQESIFLDSSSQSLQTAAQLGIKTVKVQSRGTRSRCGHGF